METENEIMEIKTTLARIESKLDNIKNQTSDHELRLRTLESRNGKRWEAAVSQIVTLVIAAVVGYFLGNM